MLPPFKEKLSAREREACSFTFHLATSGAVSRVSRNPTDWKLRPDVLDLRQWVSHADFKGRELSNTDTFNSPDANFEGNRGFLTSSSSTHTPLSSHICNRPLKSFLMAHSSTHLSITESKIISKTILLIILINLTNAINPQKSL